MKHHVPVGVDGSPKAGHTFCGAEAMKHLGIVDDVMSHGAVSIDRGTAGSSM